MSTDPSPAYGTVDITDGIWDGGTQENRFNVWSLTKNDVTLTDGSIPSTNSDSYNSVTPFDFLTGSGGSSAITGIDLAEGDIVRLVVRTADNVGDHVVVKPVLSFLPRTGGAPPTVTADVASGTYGDVQTVSLACARTMLALVPFTIPPTEARRLRSQQFMPDP